MQHDQDHPDKFATRPRLARTRFVEINQAQQATGPLAITGHLGAERAANSTGQLGSSTQKQAAIVPPLSLRERSLTHLTQLSGMLRPLRAAQVALDGREVEDDGYWPLGIQQVGPLPIINVYGREPFGRTLPSAVSLVTPTEPPLPTWQRVLTAPACKIALGLLVGLALLVLASLFVNLPATFILLSSHLLTLQGIGLLLLVGLAYLVGHAVRGLRWKLFLNPLNQMPTLTIVELYQVASFLNFLFPVRAGEAAKSLVLKRLANIPISKSLPTVAIDKALDLVSALLILAIVPFLGMHIRFQIWLILGLLGFSLLILILFVVLSAWKRPFALQLLQTMLILFPKVIENKIEGFVTGFVDALLAGLGCPMLFLHALLLTGLAVLCDGLFTMWAFQAIGTPILFSTALFGYTLCMLFSLLPTPPGQLGSAEVMGLLVFSSLLGLPADAVAAMYIFSHLWIVLLVGLMGLVSLATLGLTIKSALGAPGGPEKQSGIPA